MRGFRLEFMADLMQIDFLIAETERTPSVAKGDGFHAEDTLIEGDSALNIRNGEDEMVESIQVHVAYFP